MGLYCQARLQEIVVSEVTAKIIALLPKHKDSHGKDMNDLNINRIFHPLNN
jgi:hypothetical protein